MTDLEKKALKNLIETKTWSLIKSLILDEVDNLKLDYTKNNKELGEDAKAQYIAKSIIKKTLSKIESFNGLKSNIKNYK